MHTRKFSKCFIYWIFSYLTDRRHFAQIDSNISNILYTNLGVPQGSILGPIIFNLCVADIKNILALGIILDEHLMSYTPTLIKFERWLFHITNT